MPDLQRLADGSPVHRALGLRLTPRPEGVLVSARLGPDQANEGGGSFCHGGVIATLLDTAATFALIAKTEEDWATVDLRVDYLRPCPLGAIEVTGCCRHAGQRLGRASAELRTPEGRVLASALGTFSRIGPLDDDHG